MKGFQQLSFKDVDQMIMNYEIAQLWLEYDDIIFQALKDEDFAKVEENLSNFCLELLHIHEDKQRLFAKVYFTSILTELMRIQVRKQLLHAEFVKRSFQLIHQVEKWENLSEFLMNIPFFTQMLKMITHSEPTLFVTNHHVKRAMRHIERNLKNEDLSVAWLAEQLDISPTYLTNLFKIETGNTASAYIAKRRLKEITYDLAHKHQSMTEVREAYGFKNNSNFIQHFKKHLGMTPFQYKQNLYDRQAEDQANEY